MTSHCLSNGNRSVFYDKTSRINSPQCPPQRSESSGLSGTSRSAFVFRILRFHTFDTIYLRNTSGFAFAEDDSGRHVVPGLDSYAMCRTAPICIKADRRQSRAHGSSYGLLSRLHVQDCADLHRGRSTADSCTWSSYAQGLRRSASRQIDGRLMYMPLVDHGLMSACFLRVSSSTGHELGGTEKAAGNVIPQVMELVRAPGFVASVLGDHWL